MDWENDRSYRVPNSDARREFAEHVDEMGAELKAVWNWPMTIAFLGLLAFTAFVLWLVFG